jgi:hypothetical protein
MGLVNAIKKWKSGKKTSQEPAPIALRKKVAAAIKSKEFTAHSLAKESGLSLSSIYHWVNPEVKHKSQRLAKVRTKKSTVHKTRRARIAAKQSVPKASRVAKSSKFGADFVELQNNSGEILRLSFNKESLPFIIQAHYGRE